MTLHPISGKSYFLLFALLLISAFAPAQTAVPVVLAPVPQLQFFDQSGRPLAFGCVFSYQSQTTTPLSTFSDFTGQFANPNPVPLNAGGSANIWLQSGQAYSLTVKSAGGTNCSLGQTLYTVDGVGGGASQLNTVVTPSGGSAAFTVQSQNQLFSLTLTGNVAGSPVSFIGVIAPALVTFQITEDGGGSHTFSWPSNVIGAAPIDTTANHSTSQTFIWNGTTIMPVGSGFTSAGNTVFAGAVSPVVTSGLNNIILVGGPNYPATEVGVENAITAASVNGGKVVLPPTGQLSGTTIVIASGSLTIPSNVCLVGAGPWATILEFTAPNSTGITLLSGTQKACVENLSVEIDTSATAGTGIQIGNGGAGITSFNTIDNVGIKCQGQNTSGQAGIFVLGQTSTTNVNLNKINVFIENCLKAVSTQNSEGNSYHVIAQFVGGSTNGAVFFSQINAGDEKIYARLESGTLATGDICYQDDATSSLNQVDVVCDVSTASTALNDQGSYNIFKVSSVANSAGILSLGTVAATSQYQYVDSQNAVTSLSTGQMRIKSGVFADGAGVKHKRVASCTTAASGNATCATTVTWTTAFADANYTLSCTLIGPGTAFVLESSTPIAASATVTIMNAPGSTTAASGTLDCVAVHD